jgi:ornithine cyclodeaminase/alanine dehydrogenase-like protein (mu-crystallin family)
MSSTALIALKAADIPRLLTPAQLVGLVETAALAAGREDCVVPARQHIRWPGGTLLTMPAIAAGVISVKLVSVVPGNRARELPVTNGLLVLSDGETGLPRALLDAAALTAVRTGAVGAMGVKYLTPPDAATLGVVGTGVQGSWVAISACAVRPIRSVFALRRSERSFASFEKALAEHAPGVRVVACESVSELLERTGVIVTATTSAVPVLPDEASLLEGRHFIAIGSYEPQMRELPDGVFRLSGHLVLDSELARHEVGEAVRPVEQGVLSAADVFTVGELVAARRTLDTTRTTVYKSAGMALFDLYVAHALHDAARQRGVGQEVSL